MTDRVNCVARELYRFGSLVSCADRAAVASADDAGDLSGSAAWS